MLHINPSDLNIPLGHHHIIYNICTANSLNYIMANGIFEGAHPKHVSYNIFGYIHRNCMFVMLPMLYNLLVYIDYDHEQAHSLLQCSYDTN